MDLDELKAKLTELHSAHPQRARLAEMALEEIRYALGSLSVLGHIFELHEAGPEAPLQFPKMLYRGGEPERVVESQEELQAALSEGWMEHPGGSQEPAPAEHPSSTPAPVQAVRPEIVMPGTLEAQNRSQPEPEPQGFEPLDQPVVDPSSGRTDEHRNG